MTKDKKIKIEFAPGSFDHFDGTQEELDQLIAEIERQAESGELEANSIALDDDDAWNSLSEEEQAVISAALSDLPQKRH